jgi:hypothetical protein
MYIDYIEKMSLISFTTTIRKNFRTKILQYAFSGFSLVVIGFLLIGVLRDHFGL